MSSTMLLVNIDEEVVIRRDEYNELLKDSKWLAALENAGVDNWSGIELAIELFNEEEVLS